MDFEDQVDWDEIDANRREALEEGLAELAAEERTSGADLARLFPTTGVNLVLAAAQGRGGDLLNAWDVLVEAFGRREAKRMLLLREGGTDALMAVENARRIPGVAEAQDAAFREYAERAAS